MAKLIAFYSRAGENYFAGQYRTVAVGNTEQVANRIAELTGGTLFPIRQKVPYSVDYETCIRQAKADQKAKARPQLAALPEGLDGYEEIYLGPTTGAICPWRCIPFWKPLTGRARPSIPSAPTRAAA